MKNLVFIFFLVSTQSTLAQNIERTLVAMATEEKEAQIKEDPSLLLVYEAFCGGKLKGELAVWKMTEPQGISSSIYSSDSSLSRSAARPISKEGRAPAPHRQAFEAQLIKDLESYAEQLAQSPCQTAVAVPSFWAPHAERVELKVSERYGNTMGKGQLVETGDLSRRPLRFTRLTKDKSGIDVIQPGEEEMLSPLPSRIVVEQVEIRLKAVVDTDIPADHSVLSYFWFHFMESRSLSHKLRQDSASQELLELRESLLTAIRTQNDQAIEEAIDKLLKYGQIAAKSSGYPTAQALRDHLVVGLKGLRELPEEVGHQVEAVVANVFNPMHENSVFNAAGMERIPNLPAGYDLYSKPVTFKVGPLKVQRLLVTGWDGNEFVRYLKAI